jgi:hypothetical protein
MYSDILFNKTCTPNKRHNQLPIHWILGVNQWGHEANCSSLPSPMIKIEWSYTSAPPICFQDVQKDSFTLLYLIMFYRHQSLCYCEMHASVERKYISGLRMAVTKVFHSDMSLNNQTSLKQVSQFTCQLLEGM